MTKFMNNFRAGECHPQEDQVRPAEKLIKGGKSRLKCVELNGQQQPGTHDKRDGGAGRDRMKHPPRPGDHPFEERVGIPARQTE